MIRIAVLGSTGSIGRSTLEVVRRHPDRFEVVGLTARRSHERLAEQCAEHRPRSVVLTDPSAMPDGRSDWKSGREALLELATDPEIEVVVNALVGAAGLEPTLAALEAGKRVALANKESLVAAGPLVLEAAERGGGELIPIDSEHSAILQCLEGAPEGVLRRLVLTASGGPFRGRSRDELTGVVADDALRHPTWDMGAKISIDSATLANKALEVIEAHWLYGIGYDGIEVVVHPQSIIHSMVEFVDGSILSQMGFPTMELPILYALSYPERVADIELCNYDPVRSSPLTFEAVDHDAFPMFGLGIEAGRSGGTAPAVFNAANEVAVAAFLEGRVGFLEMAEVVERVLASTSNGKASDLADVLEADREARAATREALGGAGISLERGAGTST